MLQKRPFRIGVVRHAGLVSSCTTSSRCSSPGMAIEATSLICQYLKLNCTFGWASDSDDYGRYQDGKWTGLIGDLLENRFDATIPTMFPTVDRQAAVEFTSPYLYFEHVIVTRMPEGKPPPLDFGMVFAFDWRLWFGVLACCIGLGLTISLLETHRLSQWGFASFKAFQYLGGRDHHRRPFSKSRSNVLFTLWGVSSVALCGTYTGTMFSHRLTAGIDPPFTDLPSFLSCLEAGRCKLIATHWQDYIIDRLQSIVATDPGMAHVSFAADKILKVNDTRKLWNKILSSSDAYWTTIELRADFNVHTNHNHKFRYYAVEASFKDVGAIAVPKRSPFLDQLNDASKLFSECGMGHALMQKYIRDWDVQWSDENALDSASLDHVTFRSVRSFYVFYFTGVAVGIVVLLAELLKHYMDLLKRIKRHVEQDFQQVVDSKA